MLLAEIQKKLDSSSPEDAIEFISDIMMTLKISSPVKDHPICSVKWARIDQVQANDYNPNSVAGKEMQLLYTSIKADGYTQPVVTVYDPEIEKYVIIDGFHRYFTCKTNPDVLESTFGFLPIVVLNKTMNERMAATVRHNRARGAHSIGGMSNMVFQMLDNGLEDHEICNELGMDPEELLRLKHITGFSKLFESAEYQKAWETKRQILHRKEYQSTSDRVASGANVDDGKDQERETG